MENNNINVDKNQLEIDISNTSFHKNTLKFLAGGYSIVSTICLNEWLMNDCTLSTIYIPVIIGSIGITTYSLRNLKKDNYKLKKLKSELSMIEFKENFEEKLESSKYLLKK